MIPSHTALRVAARALVVIALAGCQGWVAEPNAATDPTRTPLSAQLTEGTEDPAVDIATTMDNVNVALEAEGANYRIGIAEYITQGAGFDEANTVLSKVLGNKRLGEDFIPNDPRRNGWSGVTAAGALDNITFAIDGTGDAVPVFGELTAAQTDAAIVRATNSWENQNCSTIGLTRNATGPTTDIGRVAFIISGGVVGSPAIVADVQHAGWRDLNFAGGILGVTFTFIFVSGGVPTDADGNGLPDVAFREIYYDPSFSWADNNVNNVDVQSVAVHEIGHGLSQAHFGKVWLKNDSTLAASPRAVMNALYAGPFRLFTGTDVGGHCGNWESWPTN